MQRLLLSGIAAFWIVAIAIIAIQNATPISVQFLGFQSVPLPLGLLLAFCAAGGMVVTALLIFVLGKGKKALGKR